MSDLPMIFTALIRRAAAGLRHQRLELCPRCRAWRSFYLAAETKSTHESIYRCESCGLKMAL